MKNNRFLKIFVCIFLSFVIILGGTLGIILGVRESRTYASFNGNYVSEGVVNFLVSEYKAQYIAGLNAAGVRAYDSKYFWIDVDPESKKTYGELFSASAREYIAGILVAASLYDDNGDFGRAEREYVENKAYEVLKYRAGGSEDNFNELAEKYGFNYDDFVEGCRLLYKAGHASELIYGAEGQNLVYYPDECARYLNTYTHVSLIFIRTEETFKLDEDGKPVTDKGEYVMRPLTDEEMTLRFGYIDTLRAAIAAAEQGEDGAISPEMFEIYLEKSDGDRDMFEKGYYFNPAAEETAKFREYHPTIVDKAYEMQIGEYAEVECSVGRCFIYKYAVAEGAYADEDNQFMSDFYTDAVRYLYPMAISALASDVRFTEKYDAVIPQNIPANSDLTIGGF